MRVERPAVVLSLLAVFCTSPWNQVCVIQHGCVLMNMVLMCMGACCRSRLKGAGQDICVHA